MRSRADILRISPICEIGFVVRSPSVIGWRLNRLIETKDTRLPAEVAEWSPTEH
jgi:hypothetical protein